MLAIKKQSIGVDNNTFFFNKSKIVVTMRNITPQHKKANSILARVITSG